MIFEKPIPSPAKRLLAAAFLAATALCASASLCASAAKAPQPVLVGVKAFPREARAYEADAELAPTSARSAVKYYKLAPGAHSLRLSAPGFVDKELSLIAKKGALAETKLEREGSCLGLQRIIPCGSQPKSVIFSKDGTRAYSALLDGSGVDAFDLVTGAPARRISPPAAYAKKRGFVEMALVPARNELWVSQMTTGSVHVFDEITLEYKATINVKGSWTKVLLANDDGSLVYAANWLSSSVSVIDSATRKCVRLLKTTGTPRGLALSPDGAYLYVAIYDRCAIDKFDLKTGKRVKGISLGSGAMRHLVADRGAGLLYASDMSRSVVYKIDFKTDRVIGQCKVAANPNTIALSPDGARIFVSTRGENGPEGYLVKGLEFGRIQVLESEGMSCVDWQYGMNQPTGLAVSSDGKNLLVSDFLDSQVELYAVE
jgi:YVTN family beta-propeller protein